MAQQTFADDSELQWLTLEMFPGTRLLPLAVPVPEGSIHRLRMEKGTVIPRHTHPCDEYVHVLAGSIRTGPQVSAPLGRSGIRPHRSLKGHTRH